LPEFRLIVQLFQALSNYIKMKTISSTLAFALATVNSFSSAASIPGRRGDFSKKQKPAAFYLAGDSTTAAQSAGGGGMPPFNFLPRPPLLSLMNTDMYY
jgi:hypothetical protein